MRSCLKRLVSDISFLPASLDARVAGADPWPRVRRPRHALRLQRRQYLYVATQAAGEMEKMFGSDSSVT